MSFRKKKEKKSFSWEEHRFKRIEWDPLIQFTNKKNVQETESYFKRWKEGVFLTIFTNAIKKVIFNKLFLGVTIFTMIVFLTTNLLGIYLLKPEKLDLKTICNTWIPFAILILYVMFFEIYSVHLFFFAAKQEGIINLEIRSGYNKFKIFCERVLANKIIIFLILTILIFTQIIIGYAVDNLYLRLAIQHTLWGFLLIYLFDLFLFGFLLMLSNLGSSIPFSVIGTILGLFFAFGAALNLVSVRTLENKFNQDATFSLKETNAKYPFILRMQKMIDRYSNQNSILSQSISSFYELKDLVTDFRFTNNQKGFFTQNQIIMEKYLPWHSLKNPHYNYDDYLIELMANGLILQINQIPVYTELIPTAAPTNLEVNFSLMETNFLFQFLNQLVNLKPPTNNDFQSSVIQNSLFRSYQAKENKTKHLFEGSDGLFSFVQAISINDELKELGNLIKDAGIYLYQDRYNSYPSSEFDNIAPSLETNFQAHIWKYDFHQNTHYNQELLNNVWISDGARTFIKIFFELLVNFMDLSQPNYGKDENQNWLTAQEYNHQVQLFTYLNPFTAFTRSFYEFSHDDVFLATNYFDGWNLKTYEMWDDKKDLRQMIKFADNNQFLRIYLTQNYFNASDQENSISLKELELQMSNELRKFVLTINFDFFLDFNKRIPIEKTNEGFVIDIQSIEHQEEHYRNYINLKLVFPLISRTDLEAQEKQKNQLLEAFDDNETYKQKKYSPFFNKFINGKNYSKLFSLTPNFLTYLPTIIFPFLAIVEISVGYWMFCKSVIS